jgi:cytochrome P450
VQVLASLEKSAAAHAIIAHTQHKDGAMNSDITKLAEQFDHTSPAQMNDPYELYSTFRERCPVGKSKAYGGFSFVTRYDSVKRVYETFTLYSSTQGTGIPQMPVVMFPEDLDPPQQTRFRRVLNPRFLPEAVEKFRPLITDEVHRLIDGFIAAGSADLARDLVRPTLPAVVLPMIGIPTADLRLMCDWIETMNRGRRDNMELVVETSGRIAQHIIALAARRRAEPPQDDILGSLLEMTIDGKKLTDQEIYQTVIIILFGGLDTTSSVMLEALLYLSRNPADRDRLRSGELAWEQAIEELLRFSSPVQGLKRTALADSEIDGTPICKGEKIMAMIGSANRDDTVFKDAAHCKLDRAENPHLAFGAGAHICLGRHLARLEVRILLQAVLERLPDYVVAEDFKPEYLVGETRGMKTLPVRFTPGVPRAHTEVASASN